MQLRPDTHIYTDICAYTCMYIYMVPKKEIPHGTNGKESTSKQEMEVRFLGREDPLEKEMATHSSILAWRIPGDGLTEYSPRGHTESDMTEQEDTHIITHPSNSWS